MRSIFVLLILVMIGLNGKGQSVTALPDSVLSQCCLEVTLLNGNVTTVDWVFVQYITRDGTGTKLFVEYAPNFGGIQWETQIRIQDDFDDVLERSKFIIIPFTVGSTDYGINRNWIANIEENTTTGGTWIYGRFGTPTKRKFSAVEDYETMKNLLLACRPRAIVVAENGLYTEGDTVRMGGFLIENTSITTEGYNWQMKDTLSSAEFGLDYLTPETLDTTVYWARRSGSLRQMVQLGRRYYYNSIRDTTGGLYSDFTHSWNSGDPFLQYQIFNPSAPTTGTAWFKIQKDNSFLNLSNDATNPYYSLGWAVTNTTASLGASESGSGDPGNGVVMGAYGFGTTEFLFMKTKAVDAGTATNGQYLQLIDNSSGEVDFATIDLSAYLPIADTTAMLDPYIQGAGTINRVPIFTGSRVIGNSNIQDNNTAVSILNSKPFQLGQWTTAGRPSGVNGYKGLNTTTGFEEGYFTSQWENYITSTGAAANQLSIFSSAGKIAGDSKLDYVNNQVRSASTATTGNNVVYQVRPPASPAAGAGYGIAYNLPGWGSKAGMMFTNVNAGGAGGVAHIDFYTTNDFSTGTDGTFFSSIANRMRIDNSGRVLINTTSTSFGDRLEVNGDIATSTFRTISGSIFRMRANSGTVRFVGPGWAVGARFIINAGTSDFAGFNATGVIPSIDFNQSGGGSGVVTSDFIPGAKTSNSPLYLTWNSNATTSFTQQRFHKFDTLGLAIGGTSVIRPLTVTGTARITGSIGTGTQVMARDGNGDISNLTLSALGISGGVLTSQNFANTNLTATANRVHNFRNFSVHMDSLQRFKIGRDSFYNLIQASNLLLEYLQQANGAAWYWMKGNNNGTSNSNSIIMEDNEIGQQWIISHDNRGFGSDGFRLEHFNADNYHNSLYINKTSRLFYVNQTLRSSGTMYEADATVNTGLNKTIIRGSSTVTNTDSIMAAHYFRASNNQSKNKDVFGVYTQGVIDTMYFRLDKVGRMFQFKDAFLTQLVTFSNYGTSTTTAAALSKTLTNYGVGFATDGMITSREIKRDTTIYVVDTDYDFSAVLTTAQVASRHNRVIFLMTTTAAAGSDSELTLHTPDINLMQCEYLVRSTDEAGGFDNRIIFGTNNAVDSTNGLASNYYPSAGSGVGIRAGLRSGVYKYFYY